VLLHWVPKNHTEQIVEVFELNVIGEVPKSDYGVGTQDFLNRFASPNTSETSNTNENNNTPDPGTPNTPSGPNTNPNPSTPDQGTTPSPPPPQPPTSP